jgi:tetraacyldisaccharide 4'-kinase
MKINKPNFWDGRIGVLAIILFPLSLIYILLFFLKKKFTTSQKFSIPIICVGNIYIGGTGKTPTSLLLSKEIKNLGKRPAIIRKYYNNHTDEYNQIKSNSANLITCENRVDGINTAKNNNFNIAILDDGFQDYKIKKDLNIVCFNNNQLIGNGLVLPAGPLRENLNSLKNADIIIINGKRDKDFEDKILNINSKLEIFYSFYKPVDLDRFKNQRLFALAGIANPKNFFKLIEENNLVIEKKLVFPDHYKFSKDEIQNIITESEKNNCQILMTEKDYFKINHFNLNKIDYLKVKLEIKEVERLKIRIKKIYDKNN